MKLYGYFRSSASFRVRIALALKGIEVEQTHVHLPSGAHRDPAFLARNPQGFLPALELDDGTILTQSLAIIEYLDEIRPEPPLLPADPAGRARVRAMAELIACDIHPLNNLRVLKYLKDPLGHDQETVNRWYRHWIAEGFAALETLVSGRDGACCHGNQIGLADICLVPQMWNARRFETDLSPYPRLVRIDAALRAHPAFLAAAPEQQPDFTP